MEIQRFRGNLSVINERFMNWLNKVREELSTETLLIPSCWNTFVKDEQTYFDFIEYQISNQRALERERKSAIHFQKIINLD